MFMMAHPLTADTAHERPANDSPTVLQLQNQLAEAHRQMLDLKESFEQLKTVQEEYSKGIEAATQMAREYQNKEESYIQSLHEHYSAQLLQARNETIEAQLTHQAWQARLQTLNETVKAAYKAREEEGQPYRKRIAALKEENRILRAQAGWEPPLYSDDDAEDEEHGFGGDGRRHSSRASKGTGDGERISIPYGAQTGVAAATG